MENLIILLILIPFLASFISLLGKYFLSKQQVQVIVVGALCTCLILLAFIFPPVFKGSTISYSVGGWREPIGICLYIDGLAWISSLIGLLITLLAFLFAMGEEKYEYKFYFFFLILLGGMQGVILTGDLFNMFVFFEILSIASYILIAYPQKEKSIIASFNYLLISSLGIGFYLLGIALLYQQTGILSLREISHLKTQIEKNSPLFSLSLISLIAGIGVKAAFIPFHTWLPDAHAFAPHPVSATLSGVMIKVSFLAVWRILDFIPFLTLQILFMWIGVFTAFLGIIWAIAQDDTKKLLAYSSISQMGFIIASFGVATSVSLVASLYHILNHSLFKSLLFLTIGTAIYTTGKREINKISIHGEKMFLVKISFLVGALSICGIAPFNGYVSKRLIFFSFKRYPILYYLIFAANVGTVASFIKLSQIFRRGEKKVNKKIIPKKMLAPLIILSLLCLFTGIFPVTGTEVLSRLLLKERISFNLQIYSLSGLGQSIFIFSLGLFLYFLITSSKGEKVLKFIRNIRCGLNNALLLFIAGFLFFTLFLWIFG